MELVRQECYHQTVDVLHFPKKQMDMPEVKTVLLESDNGIGPYKTKGIGESPNGPIAAPIANAIADAVGVRIQDLPLTSEKVYRALKGM